MTTKVDHAQMMWHGIILPQLLERQSELGINQRQLAKRVGVHPANVGRIMAGTQIPSVLVFLRLRKALGFSDEINLD